MTDGTVETRQDGVGRNMQQQPRSPGAWMRKAEPVLWSLTSLAIFVGLWEFA